MLQTLVCSHRGIAYEHTEEGCRNTVNVGMCSHREICLILLCGGKTWEELTCKLALRMAGFGNGNSVKVKSAVSANHDGFGGNTKMVDSLFV